MAYSFISFFDHLAYDYFYNIVQFIFIISKKLVILFILIKLEILLFFSADHYWISSFRDFGSSSNYYYLKLWIQETGFYIYS